MVVETVSALFLLSIVVLAVCFAFRVAVKLITFAVLLLGVVLVARMVFLFGSY